MAIAPDASDMICDLLRNTVISTKAEGFVLGLSGGVDSALAAALCCRAIGPDKVLGLFLPSDQTPSTDENDVTELCSHLGMTWQKVPIGGIVSQYTELPGFTGTPYLLGNIMARTRMALVYYYANRSSRLVCGTSNRTEYLLGYCTKFGDNAADIQPLLHLLKEEVYTLARRCNIPDAILSKPPSAGLWKDQTDEGELGLRYSEIDSSIRNLEKHNWIAEDKTERSVLDRIEKSRHKRENAPHL